MVMRVGSLAPGCAGSSLSSKTPPASSSCDWFATTLAFASTGASTTSNSMVRSSPAPARLRPRTSTRPVPLAPPLGSVLLVSAPNGALTRVRLPGANAGLAFNRSSSSEIAKSVIGWVPWFSTRRR